MQTRLLTDAEFKETFSAPMRDVSAAPDAVLDIWEYVDSIELVKIGINHINKVEYVYRDSREHYDHVAIGTSKFNALLVIVVDRWSKNIFGHILLDLEREYGRT